MKKPQEEKFFLPKPNTGWPDHASRRLKRLLDVIIALTGLITFPIQLLSGEKTTEIFQELFSDSWWEIKPG